MKLLFNALIVTCLLSACIQKPAVPEISNDHKRIMDKAIAWKDYKYQAPNSILADQKRKETLEGLKSYLVDSLKYFIKNVRVKMDQLKIVDLNGVAAFYAEFSDKEYNQYFMEFDYPLAHKDSIQKNPAYKLLINIPEKQDTVLSFFFMGDAEWDQTFNDNFRIRVVPFAKDFNADSARKANLK